MTDQQIQALNEEYADYCKHDGRKEYHLPFIIWLKQRKKIDPSLYYRASEE